LKLGAAFNTVNTSIPAFLAQNALAFVPGEGMLGDATVVANNVARTSWQDFVGDAQAQLAAVKAQYGNVDAYAMAQQQGQSLYRGVAAGSVNDVQQAAGGAIVPRGGDASPWLHVNEGITTSQYTSWTTDINVARRFAGSDGPIFQVNQNNIPNVTIDASTFSRLPGEHEVLIKGTVYGVNRIGN
jgi:hypothetical protein